MKTDLLLVLIVGALGLIAVASAADTPMVIFPEPQPAGFAGSDIAIKVRIENPGQAAIDGKLFTRLWQLSSATLVPLGEAMPWWDGRIEAGKSVDATARIALPAFRTATRLRLQLLAADGAPAGKLDVTAIPRDWLRGEIAALPAPPALYDPQGRLAPAFAKLGIEATILNETAEFARITSSLVILVFQSETEVLSAASQRLIARGVGVVWIQESQTPGESAMVRGIIPLGTDLATSAPAQFRLVQWMREALRRKQSHRTTNQ